MRRGIFGGSFDPVHYGHLLLAETARDSCSLDQVLFVPARIPPHKQNRSRASDEIRYEMIRAAIHPYPEYTVSPFELDSPEISYTTRTLQHFHSVFPDDELFLITGSETFSSIPEWYHPEEIVRLASMIIAQRPGFPPPDFKPFLQWVDEKTIQSWKDQIVKMPQLDLSSTEIRQRVEKGKSIRFMVPDIVEELILENGLYLDKKENFTL